MEFPLVLPDDLQFLTTFKTEQDLFSNLSRNTETMIRFFEVIADNYTWTHQHSNFTRSLLNTFTQLFFEDRLALDYARKVYLIIQNNYDELSDFIPQNITLEAEGKTLIENSLILGVGSRVLRDLIRQECRLKKQNKLVFEEIPYQILVIVIDYLRKGTSNYLWRVNKETVLNVFKQALEWEIKGLENECEEEGKRFIFRDDLLHYIIQVHEYKAWKIKNACYEVYNEFNQGIRFQFRHNEDFAIEFRDLKQVTLIIFDKLAQYVTHITFTGNLLDEASFPDMLMNPLVRGMGVEESEQFSPRLLQLPETIIELDLSRCEWLSFAELRQIVASNSQIESWSFSSNTHLGYNVWGELSRARNLKELNISRCHQVSDAELKIIVQGCVNIEELNISECKNITARSFVEIAQSCPRLKRLICARGPIADQELYEIGTKCHRLLEINLTRCHLITEKGLADFLNVASQLISLNVSHMRLDKSFLKNMAFKYPSLDIIY